MRRTPLLSLALVAAIAAGQNNYTLLPLSEGFRPTGISYDGIVCGNYQERAAFFAGSLTMIPTGGTTSRATEINSGGVITGSFTNGFARPYRYDVAAGTFQPMSPLLPFWLLGEGYGINTAGAVVGHYIENDSSPKQKGFLWTTDPLSFRITPERYDFATVHAINDVGDRVGEADNQATRFAGFDGINSVQLGFLPGGWRSAAYDVNNASLIVGFSNVGSGEDHAMSYQLPSGPMVDLGALPSSNSRAMDVNNHGVVVGFGLTPTSGERACRWGVNGMQDLNSLILTGTKGWVVRRATAINDQGWIAAEATSPFGQLTGVILIPDQF